MANSIQMWSVVIIYLLACIAAGMITARKAKSANAEDYYTSKNQLPPLAVAFSLVGTAMSGAMFLGVPGQAYTKGWPIVFGICMTSGMVGVLLANLLLAKPMRYYSEHHSCTTITEILVDIYEDRRLRYILIPTILLGNLFYGMAQWVSIGNLFAGLVGMNYQTAVIAGVVVTLLYTLLGGNSSNALVSVVQMFIACVASIYVIFLALYLSGGFVQMNLNMAGALQPDCRVCFNHYQCMDCPGPAGGDCGFGGPGLGTDGCLHYLPATFWDALAQGDEGRGILGDAGWLYY